MATRGSSASIFERTALADRQSGAMPTYVREREDAIPLWAAFRRHVGLGWTDRQTRDFIAGWDARASEQEQRR